MINRNAVRLARRARRVKDIGYRVRLYAFAEIAIFETGAILQYLGDKAGRFYPAERRARSAVEQWLFWQCAGLGPMVGQAAHFNYQREKIPYAIQRYTNELNRLLLVLERRLGEAEYLAGDEFSIADIAIWPGRSTGSVMNVDLQADYPNTCRWFNQIALRPGVIRGRDAEKAVPAKYLQRKADLTEEQRSNMFGERMLNAVRL